MEKETAMLLPWKYDDHISGDELEISISDLYTTLRINHRYYYFRSDDGRFDGTGTAVADDTPPRVLSGDEERVK